MKVLLTGARGFLGGALMAATRARGINVVAVVRRPEEMKYSCDGENSYALVPTLLADTDWGYALSGIDVVVHCAARVHVMNDVADDPLTAFRVVNLDGTLNLATQAAQAGVRRFVFVSSVKVNGEGTAVGAVFNSVDVPCPEDPYGISKYEAELGLCKIANETGMEVVIVRPPVVYGPGVKGNFANMLRCLQRGIPLPLGLVTENRRSLVALDNLVDLILVCVTHPNAANQTFLVSDGEDLSTAELLRRVSLALKRPARLLNVPVNWLAFTAKFLGKKAVAQRLLGNLQVDISHTCRTLDWKPPVSVDEGLVRLVKGLNQ